MIFEEFNCVSNIIDFGVVRFQADRRIRMGFGFGFGVTLTVTNLNGICCNCIWFIRFTFRLWCNDHIFLIIRWRFYRQVCICWTSQLFGRRMQLLFCGVMLFLLLGLWSNCRCWCDCCGRCGGQICWSIHIGFDTRIKIFIINWFAFVARQ